MRVANLARRTRNIEVVAPSSRDSSPGQKRNALLDIICANVQGPCTWRGGMLIYTYREREMLMMPSLTVRTVGAQDMLETVECEKKDVYVHVRQCSRVLQTCS